ncbi:MAG: spermidine synthase [Stellaceae bacterium]
MDPPYNFVRVVRKGGWLILKLNGDGGAHTIRDQGGGWTGHYFDYFALGPLLAPAQTLLVLGLGGGGSIASTRLTAPEVMVDAVEIDPKVVEAADRYFGLSSEDGRLQVHVADARPWLAGNRRRYDLVYVDLYQGGPYIPFYLATVEFFHAIRAHMSPDGVLMMNLFGDGSRQELLVSILATLERVFPSVVVLSVGYGNRMLLAFPKGNFERRHSRPACKFRRRSGGQTPRKARGAADHRCRGGGRNRRLHRRLYAAHAERRLRRRDSSDAIRNAPARARLRPAPRMSRGLASPAELA